ncbi:hypothetical protein ACOME3_010258 [Neoechinorhynchus agilis]
MMFKLKPSATNRFIAISAIVRSEPPKPKKKVDQTVAKLREDRRRKRLERGIRKLQSYKKVLKPLIELEPDRKVLKEKRLRTREQYKGLSEEEEDARLAVSRRWQQYLRDLQTQETKAMDRCVRTLAQYLTE